MNISTELEDDSAASKVAARGNRCVHIPILYGRCITSCMNAYLCLQLRETGTIRTRLSRYVAQYMVVQCGASLSSIGVI